MFLVKVPSLRSRVHVSMHGISKRAAQQPVFTRSRMLASTSYVGESERESRFRKVVSNATQHNKHKKMPEDFNVEEECVTFSLILLELLARRLQWIREEYNHVFLLLFFFFLTFEYIGVCWVKFFPSVKLLSGG